MALPHILLVDDERSIREPLAVYLTKQGFRVTQADGAEAARTRMAAYAIDLVILDIMMPGEDGLSLTRHIRATTNIPVILLTAKSEETDRIVGLEMGADDYVVKPFSPRELATRAKVILRRATGGGQPVRAPDAGSYAFSDWVLKAGERTLVDREGVSLPLSTGGNGLKRSDRPSPIPSVHGPPRSWRPTVPGPPQSRYRPCPASALRKRWLLDQSKKAKKPPRFQERCHRAA
jgi:CheY-like chemotaxis protein